MTYIFVIGNEKGGAGKTTTAFHLITALLHLGFSVASIDSDCRQLSLTKYLENRKKTIEKESLDLAVPEHIAIKEILDNDLSIKKIKEDEYLAELFNDLQKYDFVVADTPGSHTHLSCTIHSYADSIITPINDSFVDLDVIASVNSEYEIVKPAIYSQMIWEQRIRKSKRDFKHMQWFLLRNRLSNLDAKNKQMVTKVLDNLSKRLGFTNISGFSERTIFRELFLQGLTLLDINDTNSPVQMKMSHIAAKTELKSFLKALNHKLINDALVVTNI